MVSLVLLSTQLTKITNFLNCYGIFFQKKREWREPLVLVVKDAGLLLLLLRGKWQSGSITDIKEIARHQIFNLVWSSSKDALLIPHEKILLLQSQSYHSGWKTRKKSHFTMIFNNIKSVKIAKIVDWLIHKRHLTISMNYKKTQGFPRTNEGGQNLVNLATFSIVVCAFLQFLLPLLML